ncbi:hypothetical protein SLEP1_g46277 [Rubroshorea leprosula]|uniref:Uncharacterized protein n=1 Tax=Rubroshorea leprosula TaxID=152421 RepID=A0AAV5LLS9_9ROSI|nr:hypothetical protein SLEP1_g46277 [Rubroshorea leprosula]
MLNFLENLLLVENFQRWYINLKRVGKGSFVYLCV